MANLSELAWVPVVRDHWRTISTVWNNGTLEAACGCRHSTLKYSIPEFLSPAEEGEEEWKSSEEV
jgi:hypothetical protein